MNIYKALLIGGKTFHYVPSKNHFYSIILRIVGPRLQKFLIKNLRPNVSLIKTGYPAFFHLCSPNEMQRVLKEIGYKEIKIIPYYKAAEYFAFFTPLYILISFIENIIQKFRIKFFASGLIIIGSK